MTLRFGVKPNRSEFILSSDADFYSVVATRDGSNLPATAVFSIVWLDAADTVLDTWTATVDDDRATFNEDKTTVATLLDGEPVQGRLFYEDGTGGPELLLVKGVISDESP